MRSVDWRGSWRPSDSALSGSTRRNKATFVLTCGRNGVATYGKKGLLGFFLVFSPQEREAQRRREREHGARTVAAQIEARALERRRQADLEEREREALLRQEEEVKAQEARLAAAKAEAGKSLLADVAISNTAQVTNLPPPPPPSS